MQRTLGYMCLFQFWFPQDICLEVGLLDDMVVLLPVVFFFSFFFFFRNLHTVFHSYCIRSFLKIFASGHTTQHMKSVPQSGIEPVPSTLETRNLNHRAARKSPLQFIIHNPWLYPRSTESEFLGGSGNRIHT